MTTLLTSTCSEPFTGDCSARHTTRTSPPVSTGPSLGSSSSSGLKIVTTGASSSSVGGSPPSPPDPPVSPVPPAPVPPFEPPVPLLVPPRPPSPASPPRPSSSGLVGGGSPSLDPQAVGIKRAIAQNTKPPRKSPRNPDNPRSILSILGAKISASHCVSTRFGREA